MRDASLQLRALEEDGSFWTEEAVANATTLLMAGFSFLAQPETFSVFQEFAVKTAQNSGSVAIRQWLEGLQPGVLREIVLSLSMTLKDREQLGLL